jgi:hypothetical protein
MATKKAGAELKAFLHSVVGWHSHPAGSGHVLRFTGTDGVIGDFSVTLPPEVVDKLEVGKEYTVSLKEV